MDHLLRMNVQVSTRAERTMHHANRAIMLVAGRPLSA